jgi:hypothetical protein
MKSMLTTALEYVRNTGGGATKAHFFEDHEPIGGLLWNDLSNRGLVTTDSDGRIKPTEEGVAALIEGRDI